MLCAKCGKTIAGDAKLCNHCGTVVGAVGQRAASAFAPPTFTRPSPSGGVSGATLGAPATPVSVGHAGGRVPTLLARVKASCCTPARNGGSSQAIRPARTRHLPHLRGAAGRDRHRRRVHRLDRDRRCDGTGHRAHGHRPPRWSRRSCAGADVRRAFTCWRASSIAWSRSRRTQGPAQFAAAHRLQPDARVGGRDRDDGSFSWPIRRARCAVRRLPAVRGLPVLWHARRSMPLRPHWRSVRSHGCCTSSWCRTWASSSGALGAGAATVAPGAGNARADRGRLGCDRRQDPARKQSDDRARAGQAVSVAAGNRLRLRDAEHRSRTAIPFDQAVRAPGRDRRRRQEGRARGRRRARRAVAADRGRHAAHPMLAAPNRTHGLQGTDRARHL